MYITDTIYNYILEVEIKSAVLWYISDHIPCMHTAQWYLKDIQRFEAALTIYGINSHIHVA